MVEWRNFQNIEEYDKLFNYHPIKVLEALISKAKKPSIFYFYNFKDI
jgi:hypothetical protein